MHRETFVYALRDTRDKTDLQLALWHAYDKLEDLIVQYDPYFYGGEFPESIIEGATTEVALRRLVHGILPELYAIRQTLWHSSDSPTSTAPPTP
jgi:hypothetical protein